MLHCGHRELLGERAAQSSLTRASPGITAPTPSTGPSRGQLVCGSSGTTSKLFTITRPRLSGLRRTYSGPGRVTVTTIRSSSMPEPVRLSYERRVEDGGVSLPKMHCYDTYVQKKSTGTAKDRAAAREQAVPVLHHGVGKNLHRPTLENTLSKMYYLFISLPARDTATQP